ncbi:MAG: hypothetical protein AB1746_16115, partial [Candidatus Zixiibacteriota bacterium]
LGRYEMLENISNLDDILGLAIGFTTIMLILSLVVTALLQVLQNILRLRFNNLAYGIKAVLQSTLENNKITLKQIKKEILVPPLKESCESILVQPKKTWIEPDELIEKISSVGDLLLSQADIDKIKKKFVAGYDYMNKRFQTMLRYWAFVLAFLVAFSFQVDSLDLIKRLSSDPELQARLEETARRLVGEEGTDAFKVLTYEDISDSALILMQAKYPDLAGQLEQASGIGEDKQDIIDELNGIMAEEMPEKRAEVIEEYESLLDNLHREQIAEGIDRYQKYTGELAVFDIRLFKYGFKYSLIHLPGILITAIFLSFGAPFWFERLRELIKLKDTLKPEVKKTKNNQQTEEPTS